MPSIFASGERVRTLATLLLSFVVLFGIASLAGPSANAADSDPGATTTTTRPPPTSLHCPGTTTPPGPTGSCPSTTIGTSTTVTTFEPCPTMPRPTGEYQVMITCAPSTPPSTTTTTTTTTTTSTPSQLELFWRWLWSLLFGG